MRHVPSTRLPFLSVNALRVTMATAAIATLVAIAACSDASTEKSITAPAGPRNATTSSGTEGNGNGFAAQIQVCVSGPAGTYTFTNSGWNSGIGLDGVTPDQGDGGDALLGGNNGSTIWNPAKFSGTAYTVAAGGCNTIVTRSAPSLHYNSPDLLNGFPVANFQDDWQAVNITINTFPATVAYDHTDCVGDNGVLAPQPDPCGTGNNPTRAFANYDHGVQVTFVFVSAPTSHNCTFTQGYYKNHESYTAGVLSGNVGTTYIDGTGKLLIGAYALTAAQIDAILETPVGKGYNAGGVVFTKDQLGMIHQLITAELNIAGGAASGGIAAIITAANTNYTTATKSQLSSWTNSLDNFNQGNAGVAHCS